MNVRVHAVSIPAFSTIGTLEGIEVETGRHVRAAGDHRPLRVIGEALEAGEEPIAFIEPWALLEVRPSA